MLSATVCLGLQGRDAKVCKLHLECLACFGIVPEIGISGLYVSLHEWGRKFPQKVVNNVRSQLEAANGKTTAKRKYIGKI